MTECKGHGGVKYAEYVEGMVSDFEKSYGGYVTAFGHLGKNDVLVYELAKPFCRFQGNCNKIIEDNELEKIVRSLKGEEGVNQLKRQLVNFAKLKFRPRDSEFANKIIAKNPVNLI